MYAAVFLIHFVSAAVILLASLALMVQFLYCHFLLAEVNIFSNECVRGVFSVILSEMRCREFTNV